MLNFTFNNVNSRNFGLYVITSDHINSFIRNIEFIKVPGRTGDLILKDDSYNNKEVVTSARVQSSNIDDTIRNIESWLYSDYNYNRLQYSDGTSMLAVCTGISCAKYILDFYDITINFNCMKG